MRRAQARKTIDALDPAMRLAEAPAAGPLADPRRRDWFEAVYALAKGDPAAVPWAALAPHPLTRSFVNLQARGLAGLRVLDVGCGLGDNSECFAEAGAQVTAFDLVAASIEWAKRRFPDSPVAYRTADLFDPPQEWRGGFGLVHECYTLQALPGSLLPEALAALAGFLAPGGSLLVISRARDEDEDAAGPPWPLPRSFVAEAERQGLRPLAIEDISAMAGLRSRHWRALFSRAD
ncbi:class I SAM-dependent methyltransferase [Methylocapsa palsarum]|nr:methyltransferase domain-containing protein [Methylocapsa palsarum]